MSHAGEDSDYAARSEQHSDPEKMALCDGSFRQSDPADLPAPAYQLTEQEEELHGTLTLSNPIQTAKETV